MRCLSLSMVVTVSVTGHVLPRPLLLACTTWPGAAGPSGTLPSSFQSFLNRLDKRISANLFRKAALFASALTSPVLSISAQSKDIIHLASSVSLHRGEQMRV